MYKYMVNYKYWSYKADLKISMFSWIKDILKTFFADNTKLLIIIQLVSKM